MAVQSALRGGAWEYHSPWAGPAPPNLNRQSRRADAVGAARRAADSSAPTKPIRFWFLSATGPVLSQSDDPRRHARLDLSNELMAKVLADKGYHYQFLFVAQRQARRSPAIAQTLPAALECYGRTINSLRASCIIRKIKTWMPATSAGMTSHELGRRYNHKLRSQRK